jgi:flagellar hook-associated protein 1 FlgK
MSGISNAINTALSGLELFEAGITAVSNNLANQSTPGYAVESVDAQAAPGAAGQPGNGVTTATVTRAASGFAASLLNTATTQNAAAQAQATNLTSLSNALTNNGDVQSAINQFFQDVSTLAANPTSAAQRQTVLADAGTVVGTFQSGSTTLTAVAASATETLNQSVSTANNLLTQLAKINTALQTSPNQAGLLDQQQAALASLSSLIGSSAIVQPNGAVILTSGGTVLLDQSGPQTISVVPGTATAAPGVTVGKGATVLPAGSTDGAIGSAAATYSAALAANQSLSAAAAVFATQVNVAQAQGLTATGAAGPAIFAVPAPSVTANSSNSGGAAVTAALTNPAALPIDGGPFTLTYSAASGYTALDQASGVRYPATGTPPAFAGLTLSITGAPADGDSFTVNPAPLAGSGIAVAVSATGDLAAADPYVATAGTLQADGSIADDNAGTIVAGADNVASAPAAGAAVVGAAYYGQNLQVTFSSATAYTVATTAAPGVAIANGTLGAAGGTIAVAYPAGPAGGTYWQLPLTGAPAAGDTLTLTPGGSSSGSNATRIAAIWTNTGTTTQGTLQQAVVGLATGLGANAQAAQDLASATAGQVTTATTNLSNVAGVNTDAQAVILTNYQQAYQAAAQAISAAHTAFESLITAI